MKRHLVVLLALAVLLPGCFGLGVGGANSTVSGIVEDSQTHLPVVGALVTIGKASTTTLSDGSFRISGLTPGSYTIQISAAGYRTWSQSRWIDEGANSIGTIYIDPAGTPVQDAVVDLRSQEALVMVPYNTGAQDKTTSYSISTGIASGLSDPVYAPTHQPESLVSAAGFSNTGRGSVAGSLGLPDIEKKGDMDRRLRELEAILAETTRFGYGYGTGWKGSQRSRTGLWTTGTPRYVEGSSETFWVRKDFYTYSESDWAQVTATLKSVGNNVYVFVDDATSLVSSSQAGALRDAFEGFYSDIVSIFGSEDNPGIDGDSRVFVLVTPKVNDLGIGGYFDALNEYSEETVEQLEAQWGEVLHTNEKNMIYIATPYNSSDSGWDEWAKGALAHEFQHMIHFYQRQVLRDAPSEVWLNEGMAVLAEDLAGYGYHNGSNTWYVWGFLQSPEEFSVLFWPSMEPVQHGDYGAPYLFMRYLVDKYGTGIVTDIMTDGDPAVSSIEKASGKGFEQLFEDWARAVYLDDTPVENQFSELYNYDSLDLRSRQVDGTRLSGPRVYDINAGDELSGSAKPWSIKYLRVTTQNDERIAVDLNSADPDWTFDYFVHDRWW